MPLVTLIGEKLATEGCEFIYIGPNNECRNCKLKTVCFNLKTGRKYKITSVREKRHNCSIHEGNAAVVEVQELPIITAADKKLSEGDIAKFEGEPCKSIGCVNFELCTASLSKDKNYKILKIYENIECPMEHELKKVELSEE
ncbi:MAG: hypothetical protein A3K77_07890 [Euryarchaeota archaeon RBG_13_31_8]|nr:MAG: hypothetical protein A3K77_07890 [Euryarchaeota archaeon RBG_13_31_8]